MILGQVSALDSIETITVEYSSSTSNLNKEKFELEIKNFMKQAPEKIKFSIIEAK